MAASHTCRLVEMNCWPLSASERLAMPWGSGADEQTTVVALSSVAGVSRPVGWIEPQRHLANPAAAKSKPAPTRVTTVPPPATPPSGCSAVVKTASSGSL